MRVRRRYRVTGRVQGVGFRAWTLRQARDLGLAGFVRNDNDGSVLIEAEGNEPQLERLEALLGEGPAYASVDAVIGEPPGDRALPVRFDVAY